VTGDGSADGRRRVPGSSHPRVSPLLWCARGTGVLLLGLVLGVMYTDEWRGGSPDVVEAVERAFLYLLLASWVAGLRYARTAGVAGFVAFAGLEAVRWWTTGSPSLEPEVLVLILPSALYLLASPAPAAEGGGVVP
jgi:hypothetical protein